MKRTKCLVGILVLSVVACLWAGGVAAETTELKASCFLPKNHPLTFSIFDWMERVNKEMKGEAQVKYVGGPEVISAFEQIEAVKKGIIDISFAAGPHYASQLPVMYSLHLSRIMPWEERESGFYDLIAKEHEKIGTIYLGRWLYGPFFMWLKEPAKDMADLKGRRLRTNPLYDRFYGALGIKGVTMNQPEAYTALERGVVVGTSWPILGPREQGWIRVLKYIIPHSFYGANNCPIVFNLKTWNNLPKATREKLAQITAASERDMVAYWKSKIEKEWNLVMAAGVKSIDFAPEEAKRFVDLAYEVEWKELEKRIPEVVPKLKKTSGN